MTAVQPITPCLWFDTQAEEAARHYTGTFQNSKITTISRYGEAGREVHGQPPGTVMTVAFELDGQPFTALNGGPVLKDKYGVSWQVVPTVLVEMMTDPDRKKSGRAMQAMLQMKKLDIAELKRAFDG
jgi:predicted 3-demethylubiquinone-9 3-methyltransferase (glyoxalase superfamily)